MSNLIFAVIGVLISLFFFKKKADSGKELTEKDNDSKDLITKNNTTIEEEKKKIEELNAEREKQTSGDLTPSQVVDYWNSKKDK